MKYFIANWKEHKTIDESMQWLEQFIILVEKNTIVTERLQSGTYAVVICPPTPFLYPLKEKLNGKKSLFLGAQTLSSFESGSYTGETSAESLRGLIQYVLIGHHERRNLFHETEEQIQKEYEIAVKHGIQPILCIEQETNWIPHHVKMVAYEPPNAIGTGINMSMSEVLLFKEKCSLDSSTQFLYGGSVNESNAHEYIKNAEIDGVLVGTTSLNVNSFFSLLTL